MSRYPFLTFFSVGKNTDDISHFSLSTNSAHTSSSSFGRIPTSIAQLLLSIIALFELAPL